VGALCVCVCVDKVSVALPCAPPPLDASGGVAGGHPHVVTTIVCLACVVSLSSCSSAAPLPTRSLPFVLRYGWHVVSACPAGVCLRVSELILPPCGVRACRGQAGAQRPAPARQCLVSRMPFPAHCPPPACLPVSRSLLCLGGASFVVTRQRFLFFFRSGNGFAPPPLHSSLPPHTRTCLRCRAAVLPR
jgi:hypothetical protein